MDIERRAQKRGKAKILLFLAEVAVRIVCVVGIEHSPLSSAIASMGQFCLEGTLVL